MKSFLLLAGLVFATLSFTRAQNSTPEQALAYNKVVTQRAEKIVSELGIPDAAKALRVTKMIAQQYTDLNDIHGMRDNRIKDAKKEAGADKAAAEALIKPIEDEANTRLGSLHSEYLSKLSGELTPQQIEQVKDGMTYGVVPKTYKVYLAMLPDLTEEQKSQIMAHLVEAREHAMDAESSEKKHEWFGKYKGKINNYLSAAGYNMKKAGEDLEKRIKAEAAAKQK